MDLGFQTWKDVFEVLGVPIALAILTLLWPEVQNFSRKRKFMDLIFRELEEIGPHSEKGTKYNDWYEHQTKKFIHQHIFKSPTENRDFILSLPSELTYWVSQLWEARENEDPKQWLYYLKEIANSKYNKSNQLHIIYHNWAKLIKKYDSQ